MKTVILVVFALIAGTIAHGGEDDEPDLITITSSNLYPEGIEWTEELNFLVSSTSFGTVYKVSDDGDLTPFVADSALVGSVGLHVAGDKLLIANTDVTKAFSGNNVGFLGGVVVADLATGDVINSWDFSDVGNTAYPQMINDLVADASGNIYATDSLRSQIIKVSSSGTVSQFLTSNEFDAESGIPVGINGIEIFDSNLIVGKSGAGRLFKVPISSPSSFTEVILNQNVTGADGITKGPDGNLYVVGNWAYPAVYKVETDNDWASAKVTEVSNSSYSEPTTLAFRDGHAYVVHAHFASVNEDTFEIELIEFSSLANLASPLGALIAMLALFMAFN